MHDVVDRKLLARSALGHSSLGEALVEKLARSARRRAVCESQQQPGLPGELNSAWRAARVVRGRWHTSRGLRRQARSKSAHRIPLPNSPFSFVSSHGRASGYRTTSLRTPKASTKRVQRPRGGRRGGGGGGSRRRRRRMGDDDIRGAAGSGGEVEKMIKSESSGRIRRRGWRVENERAKSASVRTSREERQRTAQAVPGTPCPPNLAIQYCEECGASVSDAKELRDATHLANRRSPGQRAR